MTNDTPNITLTADRFEVRAAETVQTQRYEPYEAASILEGTVHGADDLDSETRKELKARLLALHKTLQETVERAAANRTADDPDWGVPANGGGE